jgi:hypothetical protein
MAEREYVPFVNQMPQIDRYCTVCKRLQAFNITVACSYCLKCRTIFETGEMMPPVETYCSGCEKWYRNITITDHVKKCPGKGTRKMDLFAQQKVHHCTVCNGVFPQKWMLDMGHSCSEVRKRAPIDNRIPLCGLCVTPIVRPEEMELHVRLDHEGPHYPERSYPTLINSDYNRRKFEDGDDTGEYSWYCPMCKKKFSDAGDMEEHMCASPLGSGNKVMSNLSAKLRAVGTKSKDQGPVKSSNGNGKDTSDPKVRCKMCKEIMPRSQFNDHKCMKNRQKFEEAAKGKKKIAVFVSPNRKETATMNLIAAEFGEKVVYVLRGVDKEREFEQAAKACGATVVVAARKMFNQNANQRDEAMIRKCDLVLAFPSDEDSPKDAVTETTVNGTKTVIYADGITVMEG